MRPLVLRAGLAGLLLAAIPARADDELRALYRGGFLRRCAANTPVQVCECVAQQAFSTREERELKHLGFAIETGALQRWLATTKQACAAGAPQQASREVAAPRDGEDVLGLNPWCEITTTPPGAQVFVGEEARGVTPLKTRLKATQENTVRVEFEGFFPERKVIAPNANQQTSLTFTLRAAAQLRASSEPPGATVLVGGEVVLQKTPGLSRAVAPGPTDVVFMLPGHVAVQKRLTLAAREEPVEAKLAPGVKVAVSSEPVGAEVRLDGVLVGLTPLELYAPSSGKRTIVVSKPGWSSVTRVLVRAKGNERVSATLQDVELAAALARVGRARTAFEQASLALVRVQNEAGESGAKFAPGLQRRISGAEQRVEADAASLDTAERELSLLKTRRAQP